MIDIHSHILPGADDGSSSMEETLKMLKQAYDAGITTVISTSHYIEDKYTLSKKRRETFVSNIQKELDKRDISVKIYSGAEAYIVPDLDDLYRKKIIPTLANSNYVLFELPFTTKVVYLENVINNLITRKYIPIIAHPERYLYVQEDPNMVVRLIEKGVLLQANYGSIDGIYGKEAKIALKKLLKMNAIHFLASDIHRADSIYTRTDSMLRKIERIIGSKKMDQLTQVNPLKIIRHKVW